MKTTYCLQVHHTHDTSMMVSLNGIPIYDRTLGDEARSTTMAPDQWLIPGVNTLALTMKRGEVGPTTAISTVIKNLELGAKLATVTWPDDFATPTESAPLGTRMATFAVPETHERPMFMDAVRPNLPREGDAEAWACLENLVSAFQAGDASRVFDALRTKSDEHHRFHGVEESAPSTVQKVVGERVKEPYWMLPLDRDLTIFEPAADGRLYRVTRLDGRPVIFGYPATAKAPVYAMHPFLILTRDGYRILF